MAIEIRKNHLGKKSYRVVVRVQRQKFSQTFCRKVDAEEWERAILTKRDSATLKIEDFKPSQESKPQIFEKEKTLTLDDLRKLFVTQYCTAHQSAATLHNETILFDKYIGPNLGKCSLEQLSKKDFVQLFFRLQSENNLSAERVNRCRQILHCMFNFAVTCEFIGVNPVSSVKRLKPKDSCIEGPVNFLSKSEVGRLLNWVKENDAWLYPKVLVLVNTGIRFGEMIALTPSSIKVGSDHQSFLVISKTYCKVTQKILNRTKSGKVRNFPLAPRTLEFLVKLAEKKKPDAPLLWDTIEECKFPTKFRKHFNKAIKETGIRKIRIHDLRHTFAVHFLESNGQLYDLQKLLGHQSIRLTERYSHFSNVMSERSRGLVEHFV